VRGRAGALLLEDGRRFEGVLSGAGPEGQLGADIWWGAGEVVFQTGMTGYQEIITDPSYRGQIVTFTAPHIGNTGVNRFDEEAPAPALAGIVVRSLTDRPSSWRSQESLPEYLRRHEIPCLTDVDTRALTRHIRRSGEMRGAIVPGTVAPEAALARLRAVPGLRGRDLVREVAPAESGPRFGEGAHPKEGAPGSGIKITVVHCGMKEGIDLALRRRGARVRIVPPGATEEELLAGDPDGLLISNGPGDPGALRPLVRTIGELLGRLPISGICLGHQVLALALGARTYKMKFGHHGINHPVRDTRSGAVLVTSQNHGFAVDPDTLRIRAGGEVTGEPEITHRSLNDDVLEGFAVAELGLRAVQFHPESNPGPHDARSWLNGVGRP
jgi:carbamoyl-phosphate synthase small subunit